MGLLWTDFDKELLLKVLALKDIDPPTLVKTFNESSQVKRTPGSLWSRLRHFHKNLISAEFYKAFTAFLSPQMRDYAKKRKESLAVEGGPWVDIHEAERILSVSHSRVYQLVKTGVVRRKFYNEAEHIYHYSKPDLLAYYATRPQYHNIRLKRLVAKSGKVSQQESFNFEGKPAPAPIEQPVVVRDPVQEIINNTPETSELRVSLTEAVEVVSDYALEREKGRVVLEALDHGFVSVEQALTQFRKMFLPSHS